MSAQTIAAALKGNESMKARANLKRELKAGDQKLSQILRAEFPAWLESMTSERLLLCAPRVGVHVASSLLLEAHLGPMQQARHITTRQRLLLAEELEKIEGLR